MSLALFERSAGSKTSSSTSAAGAMGSSPASQFVLLRGVPPVTGTGSLGMFIEDWDLLLVPAPQTTSGEQATNLEHPETQSSGTAIMELRRLTGFTWEQLAQLFDVARRSLHFWASGKPLNAANEERLHRMLAAIRKIDRGSSSENRTLLLREHEGVIPFDELAQGNYDDFVALVGPGTGRRRFQLTPLSPEAEKARRPPPPEQLVGALHDTVHVEKGRLISSTPIRRKREK